MLSACAPAVCTALLPAQWGTGSPGCCQASPQTSGLVSWLAEATFVAVSPRSGRAEVDDVLAAIRPTTCLVSIMLANNETGVIMVSLRDGGDDKWDRVGTSSQKGA